MRCRFAAHFFFEKRRFWTNIRDFAAHFFFEKRRFLTKIRDFAAHFLCQKRRFWTKIRDFAARFLLEKRRFWTKIRDFAARFSFEKRRFWTKIRENPFAEILISSTQTGDLTSNTLNLSNWTTVQLLIWKYSKKYCNGATNQHRFCGLYPTARNHSMTVIRMIRLMI